MMELDNKQNRNPFAQYGIEFISDTEIRLKRMPYRAGHTPPFSFPETSVPLLDEFSSYLLECRDFSLPENRRKTIWVADTIFRSITRCNRGDYVYPVIMDRSDFDLFQRQISEVVPLLRDKKLGGLAFGGLAVVKAKTNAGVFLDIFHEMGHCLYPPDENGYNHELRAHYFMTLCRELFELELKKIGKHIIFDDGYSDPNAVFPSDFHKPALLDAKALFIYQRHYNYLVRGNPKKEKEMARLLSLVGQTSVHVPDLNI